MTLYTRREALAMAAAGMLAGVAGRRPNIVFVLTDDQGYGEIGAHGNPLIKTPHLNRLHATSLRFTDFQVSPTCAPTRAALMTGMHEFRSGVTHTIFERERLSLQATTVAQVLKGAGYATGIFGKWHLGDEDAYQPGRRGFDETFIHGGGGIGQTYPGSCGDAPGNTYFDPAILHNGVFEKTRGFCTDLFFDRALQWMDRRRRESAPFFAYIATNAPHDPFVCPERYRRLYEGAGLDQNAIGYYGMITNIDENVGRLQEQLRAWGLERDTLLIFMTDNGHSVPNVYNAGMRGIKCSPWEGGTRVPAFFRWPGVLPEGADCFRLAAHVDLMPTFAALAGTKPPRGARLEGRSLLPLFANPRAAWRDRYLFTHVGRWEKGRAAESKYAQCAVRTARYRLVNNTELHDILVDPGEARNVIEEHPREVERMRAAYDRWWLEILPCLVNEDAVGPAENPFKTRYREQFGRGNS